MKKKKKIKNTFQKGNQKSKGFGRPPLTDAEKELTLKTRTQFRMILNKYMITSEKDLKKLKKDKDLPAIDGMIIQSVLNSLESGAATEINWFVDHTLGKAKDKTNIHLSGGIESTTGINLKKLSKEELIALKDIAEKSNS